MTSDEATEPSREAIVAVIHDAGRFLWIKRGPGVVRPGFWTPPTGTVEAGESHAEAVVREMAEELAIEVRPIRPVWQAVTEGAEFSLHYWLTAVEAGTPRIASPEVADVAWVDAEEIRELSPTFDTHLRFIDEIWPTLGTA